MKTVKLWNNEKVKLWIYENMKIWNNETLELWNYQNYDTVTSGNYEKHETENFENYETVKPWNIRITDYQTTFFDVSSEMKKKSKNVAERCGHATLVEGDATVGWLSSTYMHVYNYE